MRTKPVEVSAFEAKTRLSELLRETEAGRSFVIRRRGKDVAQLIPPQRQHKIFPKRGCSVLQGRSSPPQGPPQGLRTN